MFKNVKILEFSDTIWNHHEKCIQISTNMPGIRDRAGTTIVGSETNISGPFQNFRNKI